MPLIKIGPQQYCDPKYAGEAARLCPRMAHALQAAAPELRSKRASKDKPAVALQTKTAASTPRVTSKSLPPIPQFSMIPACYMGFSAARTEAISIGHWLHTERNTPGVLTASQRAAKARLEERGAQHRAFFW